MKRIVIILAAVLLAPLAVLHAADAAASREQILAFNALTVPPAMQSAEGFASEDGLKAIFFEAQPWKEKPTKVFAWLGLPAKRAGKVPAVVLVHDGGGRVAWPPITNTPWPVSVRAISSSCAASRAIAPIALPRCVATSA